MIRWLKNSYMWIVAWLGALLVGASYILGRIQQRNKAKVKDLRDDIETRKRVHEADDFTDADTAREWLRNRKP